VNVSFSEEHHVVLHLFLPVLWDIGDLDVFLDGLTELMELLGTSLGLSGWVPFGLNEVMEFLGLIIVEPGVESLVEVLSPVGGLEVLVLLLDVLGLILSLLEFLVVDVESVLSWLDGFVKSLTEISPLLHELLTLWGGLEFSVKLLEVVGFIRSTPLHEVFLETLSDWSVLSVLPPLFDIFTLFMDFSLSGLGNMDFETVHVSLPLWWDVGDLNVVLKGHTELFDLLLEHLTSNGFLEVLTGELNLLEGLVGEEFLESSLVFGVPVGGSEVLVVIRDIIELVGELLHGVVAEVDSVMGVTDVLLEDSADILPLLDELLTSWGSHELLVKLLDVLGSSGMSPFHDSLLERLSGWGVLNSVSNSLNIHSFFLDFPLAGWADRDFESLHGIVVLGGGETEKSSNCKFHLFFVN